MYFTGSILISWKMASLAQENDKDLLSEIRAIDPYLKKEQEQAVEKLLVKMSSQFYQQVLEKVEFSKHIHV